MRPSLLVLAVSGPALAAATALVPGRVLRRVLWFLVMAASSAVACAVVTEAYGGTPLVYRSFRAGLLPATLVAALEVGVLLCGIRAATLCRAQERLAQAGLGIGAAAAAAAAFTTSAAVLALVLPVPTLALAAATISGRRAGIRASGLVGLALADVAALAGLFLLVRRTDSNLLVPGAPDAAAWLLLSAAAVKAGAVPWVGAWGAGDGVPAARLTQLVVRVQGLSLVAVVATGLRPVLDGPLLAAAAAGLALVCGMSSLVRGRGIPGAAGLGPAVALLAVALGGSVGLRSLAVLLPALPIVWGIVWMVSVAPDRPSQVLEPGGPGAVSEPRPATRLVWAVTAPLALAAAMGAMVLMPLTGTHPGAHLTLALAATRAASDPTWLVPVAAILVACSLAAAGAVAAIREAVPGRPGLVGLVVGAASLYAGVASGPLALGWLARLERELGTPVVLPTAGAPAVPPAPALRLVLAALPAFVLVTAVTILARGVRGPGPAPQERKRRDLDVPPRLGISPREQIRFVVLHVARGGLAVSGMVSRVRGSGAAWAGFALGEALAGLLVVRLVLDAAGRGFL